MSGKFEVLLERALKKKINAGVHLNVVFPPLNMGLIEISRLRLTASQKLYAHYTILCLGVFRKFLGDFRVYFGEDW